MAKYNYALSYNPSGLHPNGSQLHIFISQNRDVETWYLPFLGTYILKSDKALTELMPQFSAFFSNAPYMLTWIPPGGTTGSLPPEVWTWINNQSPPAFAAS